MTVDFYCSQIIVHRLLFIDYYRRPKLQYNPQQPSSLPHCNTLRCIAIQFNHSSSLLFTIHKGVLQYNFFFPAHLYIVIQSSPPSLLFQYNSNPTSLLLQYKTKPTTLPRLQYNFPIAIQSQANYTLLLQYKFFF